MGSLEASTPLRILFESCTAVTHALLNAISRFGVILNDFQVCVKCHNY